MSVRGTTFQLGLLHQATKFISRTSLVSAEATDILAARLESIVEHNFSKSGFSYTEERVTPDDLDTLAATVATLSDRPAVVAEAKLLLKHSWCDRFPSVFLAEDEKRTNQYRVQFYCGENPWHVDVLLNAAIAEHLSGARFLNLDVCEIIGLDPINYWFIPCSYTLFRRAQLCSLLQLSCESRSFESIAHTNSIHQMREVFSSRRTNELETFLYDVASCGKSRYSLLDAWKRVQTDDPVLYSSIGFQPYRSETMYEALFLMGVAFTVSGTSHI